MFLCRGRSTTSLGSLLLRMSLALCNRRQPQYVNQKYGWANGPLFDCSKNVPPQISLLTVPSEIGQVGILFPCVSSNRTPYHMEKIEVVTPSPSWAVRRRRHHTPNSGSQKAVRRLLILPDLLSAATVFFFFLLQARRSCCTHTGTYMRAHTYVHQRARCLCWSVRGKFSAFRVGKKGLQWSWSEAQGFIKMPLHVKNNHCCPRWCDGT